MPDLATATEQEKKPKAADEYSYMETVRKRYESAKQGWSVIRQDFKEDIRYVSGDPGDQWDPLVKTSRDDDGIPALTMDRLNPLVNQIVNQSRKDRPQPKVAPGDGGDPEIAEVLEGKMRHVMFESHADIAFDTASAYCASGGFGFYRVVKEWTGGKIRTTARGGRVRMSMTQEPRVKRIPDPLTVLFDPEVQELDYSDARYCFVQKKYDRAAFKKEFKKDPIPFPLSDETSPDWGDESKVLVVEYWWFEDITHRLVTLSDGRVDIADEIDFDESEVISERDVIERILHCDIVDGEKRLEKATWEGQYIPIIPLVAKEVISLGKRRYLSAVRYSRDPQIFINASMSSTAEKMATINYAVFTGPQGAFKNPKWRDGKRHFYLEYAPEDVKGRPIGPGEVQRLSFEPAIQGTTAATAQGIDALKGAIGYVDSVVNPSQHDLSGVAVTKREAQQGLANIQYEDSLTDSMWHCGRVLVDLLIVLTDTPRLWDTRSESGETSKVPVTMQLPADTQSLVPGHENDPHIRIDQGEYGTVIEIGPSYATKQEEGNQFLLKVVEMNPALLPIYLPAIFKRFGYGDLAEIAEASQPPQIQQQIAAAKGAKNIPPQVLAAQAAALQQQNQQLKAVLQQVEMVLKTKQIENEGKLAVQNAKTQGDLESEKLKTIRALIEKQMEHSHDAAKHLHTHHVGAIEHLTGMLHESEQMAKPPEPKTAAKAA